MLELILTIIFFAAFVVAFVVPPIKAIFDIYKRK